MTVSISTTVFKKGMGLPKLAAQAISCLEAMALMTKGKVNEA